MPARTSVASSLKRRSEVIDKLAATIILQGALDRMRHDARLAGEHGAARIFGRRRQLVNGDAAPGPPHDVGERAAAIDPELPGLAALHCEKVAEKAAFDTTFAVIM